MGFHWKDIFYFSLIEMTRYSVLNQFNWVSHGNLTSIFRRQVKYECWFMGTFLNDLLVRMWGLSLETIPVNMGIELRATNCHFTQCFIFLCTGKSMKRLRLSQLRLEWTSHFNAASCLWKEIHRIRWLARMYLNCTRVCHLMQTGSRCKYCTTPSIQVNFAWMTHILIKSVMHF